MPETAAANRWLTEVYDPVIASMPADLRGRLDDAEVFHEILEHRWFLSEARAGTSAPRPRPPTTSPACCPRCRPT